MLQIEKMASESMLPYDYSQASISPYMQLYTVPIAPAISEQPWDHLQKGKFWITEVALLYQYIKSLCNASCTS